MSYDIAVSVMCGFPLMAPTAVIYVKSFKMLVEICRSFLYRDMYFYGLGCRIYFSDGTVKIYDILGGKMSKIGRGVRFDWEKLLYFKCKISISGELRDNCTDTD